MPLNPPFFIDFSQDALAWLVWSCLLLGLFTWGYLAREPEQKLTRRDLVWLAILSIMILITTAFGGVELNFDVSNGIASEGEGFSVPTLMFLAALPWMLAAGFVGTLPAMALALASGFLFAFLDTHNIFTPLIFTSMALIFSLSIGRDNRSRQDKLLRNPIISSLITIVSFAPLLFLILFFSTAGSFGERFDISIESFFPSIFVFGMMVLIGGVCCQVSTNFLPKQWDSRGVAESDTLKTELNTGSIFTWIGVLVVILIGEWLIFTASATEMLVNRIESTGRLSTERFSQFMNAGMVLISSCVDNPQVVSLSEEALLGLMDTCLDGGYYFQQVMYLDAQGNLLAVSPRVEGTTIMPIQEEIEAINQILAGIPTQYLVIPRSASSNSYVFSFVAVSKLPTGEVAGVMVGRTFLELNASFLPVIRALENLETYSGNFRIFGTKGGLSYQAGLSDAQFKFDREVLTSEVSIIQASADGERFLVYYQNNAEPPWLINLFIPVGQIRSEAWGMAFPVLILTGALIIGSYVFVLVKTRRFDLAINAAIVQVRKITIGNYDESLKFLGRWGKPKDLEDAFERLRCTLRAQNDTQHRLLSIDQNRLINLEFNDVLVSILRAALGREASSARIIMDNQKTSNLLSETRIRMGQGERSTLYAYLDEEIYNKIQGSQNLILSDLKMNQVFNLTSGMPFPESLVGLPLIHTGKRLGVLWVAFDRNRWFTAEDITFFENLAQRASAVIFNTSRFYEERLGKQRLEKVLDSIPDPLLFFDQQGLLVYANHSAGQIVGINASKECGTSLREIINEKSLLDLIEQAIETPKTAIIEFPKAKVFKATTCAVMINQQQIGVLCTFSDFTRLRELDAQKTEFVTTVSHDLRTPLTLMKGYVAMLKNIGNLNDQQQTYIQRILSSVDSMSHLVNNILNIERIESGDDLQISSVPIKDIIQQVVASFEMYAQQRKIVISTDFQEVEPLAISADRALLQQALYNLVD
ncbi:MAG: histidine kinase dimerization/phospho-acceptor domain-containing protein, partial [Chloroflexota bacterium]